MTGTQSTIFDAIAQRDEAMYRVAANNEELNQGWADLAFAFLKQFAMRRPSFFPYELTAEFEKAGFVQPHDLRAFGQIYRRAVKEGIVQHGTSLGKHPKRHATACLNWNSLIYKGGMNA